MTGEDAVLAMYQQTGTPCIQHCVSNAIVTLDAGSRTTRCHSLFSVFHASPDFPMQSIIAGHYNDRLAIINSEWWFTEREMVTELLGDLSRHLLFDPSTLSSTG